MIVVFLKLKNSSIAYRVTGEKVNREGGYGLEIPCEYLVEGDTRAVNWLYRMLRKKKNYVKI